MGSKATTEFRKRRKSNLIKVSGNKCCLCGYDKIAGSLEFHHLDPSKKSYGIASCGTCHDLETDLQEIQKCILVCANCHREIHSGLYPIEVLEEKRIFDENVASQLREEKRKLSEKTYYYCKNCGKQLYEKTLSGFCRDCYIQSHREGRPNREELKQLIRTLPFTKIGEKYGISDNGIRKWCEAENLPTKKKDINSYSDEEWNNI